MPDDNATAVRGRYVLNHSAREGMTRPGLFNAGEYSSVTKFFRSMSSYVPTPLWALRAYGQKIGVREILVKDESARLGLNSFKVLGVSYAVHKLIESGAIQKNSVLVAATDGNHGRALARVARLHGLKSIIYIHEGAATARIRAISSEGADVIQVAGNYDDSVRMASEAARMNGWTLVSDTSWPGYEVVPRYVMAGYTMIMNEVVDQWCELPDAVFVQAGVGGLVGAVLSWFLHNFGSSRPLIVACEPNTAACVLESMRAGQPVTVPGSLETAMAGLSCGTVSLAAWPVLQSGLDACLAITDEESFEAMQTLAHPEPPDPLVTSGESGACGLASVTSTMRRNDLRPLRSLLHLGPDSRVLVINTEGATDPASYDTVTGIRAPEEN